MKWREFEKLAEKIFSELNPLATVRWNDSIKGDETGIRRQIDVSILFCSEGREHLVIVQTKNLSNRADINVVGEFASVVRDVGASGGVLVCRSGFSNNAQRYARNIGIHLLNLHDASTVDWRRHLKIPILWIDLEPKVSVEIEVWMDAGDSIPAGTFGVKIDDVHDVELRRKFIADWNAGVLSRTHSEQNLYDAGGTLFIPATTATGEKVRRMAKRAECSYRVERRSWLGSFEPEQCRGIVDYLNDEAFVASHLPVGEIPIKRDERWEAVEDPEKIAVSLRGTFVTTENVGIDIAGSSTVHKIRYLEE